MRNDPYRHSVWIDVFGVVLFGAVLLGGAGYLLYHAESAATGLAVEPLRHSEQALAAQRPRRAPARRGASHGGLAYSPPAVGPLLEGRSSWRGSSEAPFSKEWREQATPRLSEPSGSSGGGLQGSGGGGAPAPSGPAIASSRPSVSRPSGGLESGNVWDGGPDGPDGGTASRSAGSGWRAEARRLSGRARALASQLGQMSRSSSGKGNREGSSSGKVSAGASAASASSSDRDAPSPPSVPIDDHVYWLAIAGLIWGVWRLT